MNAFRLLGMELSKLKEQKGLLFSLLGVLLIPLVYAAILLSSTWGPYDYLNNLPVAVVNKDQGGTSGDKPINVGEDLVADLKKTNTLGWEFVSEEEAQKGLDSQKYYMVIEIPEDFSQKVTTVLDANPQVPELKYVQNEGLNFMAAQVTRSATEKIREQLGNKITETYANNLFTRFGDISNGFKTGAEGSQKIYDGTTQLSDGTGKLLQSLTDKSADIQKLADGSQKAENGAGQLLSSIKGGTGDINKLAAGSKQIDQGAGQLQEGSAKVLAGLQSAETGGKALATGLESKIMPGSALLASKTGDLATGAKQLSDGSQGLTALLKGYLAKHPELLTDPEFLRIVGTSEAISGKMPGLVDGANQLKAGADSLAAGIAKEAVPGSKKLASGLSELVVGQKAIGNGISDLKAGASQVANGNASVANSWVKMTSAVASLQNGLSQISSGNETVASGWQVMTEGVTTLDSGAKQLQSGSQQLSDGLAGGADEMSKIQVSDANISMFSSPVNLTGEKVNGFEFYRDSTAPYVLSLALFVGALILSFIIDFKKPAGLPSSAMSWYVSKLMKVSLFAVAQGVLVSLFSLLFLQLKVENAFLFVGFSVFTSLAFMSMVFFLVTLGGNIGRFVALAFIVLQLSTTGSNLPIPMLPENLQVLSKFLPLTYSNTGFKSIISLGDTSFLASNATVLFFYLVGFAVLSLGVFLFSFKKSKAELSLAA
ncbi:YhgE/Pip family protein [Peribacillus acanthi]|uniref:YhgE/Pip family protein n=1 Tax=Peribacillus acanthi TaxID=2171554 RepID=UPI000D3E6A7A|nr:YhgE/Pip domain-containing protein [Peribacillus acanthi]